MLQIKVVKEEIKCIYFTVIILTESPLLLPDKKNVSFAKCYTGICKAIPQQFKRSHR